MNDTLTVAELHDKLCGQLELEWIAGKGAAERRFVNARESSQIGITGYFNPIHSSQVHIVDKVEMNHLHKLEADMLEVALEKLFSKTCLAVIVTSGQQPMRQMVERADANDIGLFTSDTPGEHIVNDLRYLLARALAEKITMHGVFMEVTSIGVLLTGESGVGKSELALELITRGHRLIADDAPVFTRIAPDIIEGRSPPVIQDFLEVRGLGVLNIRKMYGNSAIKKSKYLKLIIHFEAAQPGSGADRDRLAGLRETRDVLGLSVPVFKLPVAPGRNLAVMAEAAVRNHLLQLDGDYTEREITERQRACMDGGTA